MKMCCKLRYQFSLFMHASLRIAQFHCDLQIGFDYQNVFFLEMHLETPNTFFRCYLYTKLYYIITMQPLHLLRCLSRYLLNVLQGKHKILVYVTCVRNIFVRQASTKWGNIIIVYMNHEEIDYLSRAQKSYSFPLSVFP